MKCVEKKLRVLHLPKVPCSPFIVDVKDEEQAILMVETLAKQHLFLYDNNIIPDYSNVICVEMLEDGEWTDYYNEFEYMEFDEFASEYKNQLSLEEAERMK